MSKRRLLEEFNSNDLSELLAFDRLYTLPDEHYTASTVSLTVAKSMGSSKLKLEDFAPIYKAPKRRPTAEEVLAIFRGMQVTRKARV